MATSRGRRVTVVNPWIPGGEGQLRDLFPMPPALFLFFRFIAESIKHFIITLVVITALYLWVKWDWAWYQAFIFFPLAFLFLRLTTRAVWLWYRNPTIPLFTRKP